jgi:Protein of unknown function (DUF3455)
MFDISCLYGTPEFSTIQSDAFYDWDACPSFDPLEPGLVQEMNDHYGITVDGEYYFVEQNGALVPVWDLRSTGPFAGNPNAIVFAQKYKSTPSPNGPVDIDWVELKKLSGGLANLIYRVNTVQGQPPPTVSSFLIGNLWLSYLIQRYISFVVQPRHLCNCQIYGEIPYVSMT